MSKKWALSISMVFCAALAALFAAPAYAHVSSTKAFHSGGLLEDVLEVQREVRAVGRGVTAALTIERNLALGSRGDDVLLVQRFLAAIPGMYPEKLLTGYYGPLTRAAVERFQDEWRFREYGAPGVEEYGSIGPRTRTLFNAFFDPSVRPLPFGFTRAEYNTALHQVDMPIAIFPSSENIFIAMPCREQPSVAQVIWASADRVRVENGIMQHGYGVYSNIVDCAAGQETAWMPLMHYTGGYEPPRAGEQYRFQVFFLAQTTSIDRYLYDPSIRHVHSQVFEASTPSPDQETDASITIPIIELRSSSSMIVSWHATHMLHPDTFVEYKRVEPVCGCEEEEDWSRVYADGARGGYLVDGGQLEYRAVVDDLVPGIRYVFRAGGGADYAPDGTSESFRNHMLYSDTVTAQFPL